MRPRSPRPRSLFRSARILSIAATVASIGAGRSPAQDGRNLTLVQSALFSGSGNCVQCHSARDDAVIDSAGESVSPALDWRSTMMANSARDPLWQAKVEAEVSEHPHLAAAIETKCTRCHAPAAHEQALRDGSSEYRLTDLRISPLALDGVTCTLCHQILPDGLGEPESFSGQFVVTGDRTIFGPYDEPVSGPMRADVQYDVAYGRHTQGSELCATCHTLFTSYVGSDGELTGSFPEQVPYFEWTNSEFPAQGIECQSCHMPQTDSPVKIADRPPWLEARSPYWKHQFVGGNAYVLGILRDNGDELGVTATTEQFDRTIELTRRQLRERTATLEVDASIEADELTLDVLVTNLAGHKFPTGFPSRRAWLHVRVVDGAGTTMFESGAVDDEGRFVNAEVASPGHRDLITRPEEVQVWQARMADVDGRPTLSLLRAATYLEDNRLPPRGFVRDAEDYEHMAIVGPATGDADFNRDTDGREGSGSDRVTYRLAVGGTPTPLEVTVELLYQTASPEFLDDLASHDTDATRRFARFREAAGSGAELVQRVVVTIPAGDTAFRRGDINADARVDLSDAIFVLTYLFGGGPPPDCARAADLQPDDAVDVSDPILLLQHLFLGGQPPAEPFATCGVVENEAIPCLSFLPCP